MNEEFADAMEAVRAQRTENADKVIHWFVQMMVQKRRADKAEARVKELEDKHEKKAVEADAA